MFRYEFAVEDLARTRFAISPMWELVQSLVALRDPASAALHLPWLRRLSGRLGGLDLVRAAVLVPPRGYIPDFLTPPPDGPLAAIGDELDRVARTPAAQIRSDMERFRREHRAEEAARPWLERPRRELGQLLTALEGFWEVAHAPNWPRLQALLDADLAYRTRALAGGGAASLLADLHADVRWTGDALEVERPRGTTVILRGRGLLLMPSAFTWQRPANITDEPWQPTLVYPARGIATLWETQQERSLDALAAVIGKSRARLLAVLEGPATTSDLAQRLHLSAGGVSQHLSALRGAGLVTATRDGHKVLYARTELADGLMPAAP
jgi:hypothetical protein